MGFYVMSIMFIMQPPLIIGFIYSFHIDLTFTKDDAEKLHSLLLPIARDWRILGVMLGFKTEVLDSLQAANTTFLDFILAWIDGRGGPPTLRSLREALHDSMLKKNSLATEIAKGINFIAIYLLNQFNLSATYSICY